MFVYETAAAESRQMVFKDVDKCIETVIPNGQTWKVSNETFPSYFCFYILLRTYMFIYL